MHGMATEQDGANDGDIGCANEDVGDLDTTVHIDQTGSRSN